MSRDPTDDDGEPGTDRGARTGTDPEPPGPPGAGGDGGALGDGDLAVGGALAGAAARLVRPGGLLLLVGYLFVGLAGAVATESLYAVVLPAVREAAMANPDISPRDLPPVDPSPLAVATTPATAVAMVTLTALVAEALNVVAVRTFVRDATSVPREALTELPARTGASFVANVLVNVAVFLGLVAFVLPGAFLAASFYAVRAVVAVEGTGVGPALRRSWRLTAGNRLRVLLVLLTVLLAGQTAGLPVTVLGTEGTAATLGATVGVALGAVVAAFGSAAAARVYVQLAGIDAAERRTEDPVDDTDADEDADEDDEDDEDEDEPLGALSPEEIDERFDDDRA